MYFLSGNTEYGHLFHDHNLQIYSGKNELPQHQLPNPSPERSTELACVVNIVGVKIGANLIIIKLISCKQKFE